MGFDAWLSAVEPEIEKVKSLLALPLNDNPVALCEDLRRIDAWQGRLTTLFSESGEYLEMAMSLRLSDLPDLKALDKEIRLKAATSRERKIYNLLHGLSRAASSRIMLGMSLLKASKEEQNITGKQGC